MTNRGHIWQKGIISGFASVCLFEAHSGWAALFFLVIALCQIAKLIYMDLAGADNAKP